jgi:hypothetical protein
MPVFLAALLAGLSRLILARAGAWLIQALIAVGIGFAVKEFALDPLMNYVQSYWAGIPSDIAAWMGVLNLDIYVVGILSAYAASTVKQVIVRRLTA